MGNIPGENPSAGFNISVPLDRHTVNALARALVEIGGDSANTDSYLNKNFYHLMRQVGGSNIRARAEELQSDTAFQDAVKAAYRMWQNTTPALRKHYFGRDY